MSKLCGDSEWALLLAPELPYPLAGGGAMRTASLLHFLAARFRLHLVSFTMGDGPQPASPFPPGTVERVDWIRLPVHRRSLAARGLRNARRLLRGRLPLSDRFCQPTSLEAAGRAVAGRRYALAVIEHFWCAAYLDVVRGRAGCVLLDMHNVESALHQGCARAEGWPARWGHRAFALLARQQEQHWLPRFDLVLAASDADRRRLAQSAPGARLAVYPNALPLCFPAEVAEDHCLAFSGNMEYRPNRTAVRYFARHVWPRLRRQDPELRWRLIGKNAQAVADLVGGDPRIEITGEVEDSLAELARARVVVAPLLSGSGTRVKILEAWAAGRAVVSTRLGAEGLPAIDGENLLLADDPDSMGGAIETLLRDGRLRRHLGQAGRRLVETQFCWPAAWWELELALAGLIPQAAARER